MKLGLDLHLGRPGVPSGGAPPSSLSVSLVGFDDATDTLTFTASGIETAGTLYWLLDANATRTAAQVIAGGGSASGSFAVNVDGEGAEAIDLTGVANGSYYLHLLLAEGADQSAVDSTAVDVTIPPFDPVAYSYASATLRAAWIVEDGAVWQDAAGTVAAATADDPVRRVDAAAGGVNLLADADAERPLRKATPLRVEFDNSDDGLHATSVALGGGNDITLLLVGTITAADAASASNEFFVDIRDGTGNDAYLWRLGTDASGKIRTALAAASDGTLGQSYPVSTVDKAHFVEFLGAGAGATSWRENSASPLTATVEGSTKTIATPFGTMNVSVGNNIAQTRTSSLKFRALFIWSGTLTDGERADLTAWAGL